MGGAGAAVGPTATVPSDEAPATGGTPGGPGGTWLPPLSGAFVLVGLSLLVLRGLASRVG